MNTLLEDLKNEIKTDHAVVVLGAGATTASVEVAGTSWSGLLANGARRAAALGRLNDADLSTLLTDLQSSSTTDVLGAADRVVNALGGLERGEFGRWLREDVGYLSRNISDDSIARRVGELDIPILTTNYDDVLERALNREFITWQQPEQVQNWVRGNQSEVLHLHGHWRFPESVVMTARDYEEFASNQSLNFLRQTIAATKSMIFVGCGDGLSDPSFGALRLWIQEVLPLSQVRHFRLCRTSEYERLNLEHNDESIYPIVYGDSYEDLAPFLADLVPEKVSTASVQGAAFAKIEERVRESAVLAAHIRGADEARVDELLLPPVLLPMTEAQFLAAAKGEFPDERPVRSSLDRQVEEYCSVISGEEYTGVTSALLWLCSEMYLQDKSAIPLIIDYRQLAGSQEPLRRRVTRELRSLGFSIRTDDDLPPVVIALDNVNGSRAQRLERLAGEIASNDSFKKVIIGCRTGSESIISNVLLESGVEASTRFIGRLARPDLLSLAQLVDSPRADELTRQAARVVESQELPSTPFTLSMILSALIRGESLIAATSPTSLLDAYVELLLGRGSRDDDSRFGLDAVNKSYIVSRLAEEYAQRNAGALSETEVVNILANVLDLHAWSGNGTDVLQDLVDRRVLVVHDREVRFSQNSYLYLFSAKRAQSSREFLDALSQNPLYYSPILAHYAALKRDDFDFIKDLIPRLLQPLADVSVSPSIIFQKSSNGPDEALAQSDDQVAENFHRELSKVPEDPERVDERDITPLGGGQSDTDVPFPLGQIEDAPPILYAMAALALASNLLRDTEIVEDQPTRRALFTSILKGWGILVDLIESDENESQAIERFAEQSARDLGLTETAAIRIAKMLTEIIPAAVAFSGISSTLSSDKFGRLIDDCLKDDLYLDDPLLLVFISYVLFDVHGDDWTRVLPVLQDRYLDVFAVRQLVQRMAYFSYLRKNQRQADDERLQSFLVDCALEGASPQEKAARKGTAIQGLRRARIAASRRQIGAPTDDSLEG